MIKIGIAGYGNLGRGVETAIKNSSDMELTAVFTRRENVRIKTEKAKVIHIDRISEWKNKIDVIINCGGSATDLPVTTPIIAENFNVVDSFDTHTKINEHFANVDRQARKGEKIAIISVGWDPGLFSLSRLLMNAALPNGNDYTFWGRGVSQGHSDAIRRIDGVADARQYTVPIESAVKSVRSGENPKLTGQEMHKRECYVVTEDGADRSEIKRKIKTMPDYFDGYFTTVKFVSQQELDEKHSSLPHGGSVIRSGYTGIGLKTKHTAEFSLKLESNPEFTGSVLTAYARAAYKLNKEGECGCKTVFDVPPGWLLPDGFNRHKLL